jgi:diguanylate cyclase (GGDEF)-like protein/PAS domain S-box-containing protein
MEIYMNISKEEDNRYKYVVDNIRDIIWEMDLNLTFTFVSQTIKEAAGYEADELIGRRLLDFITEESRAQTLANWQDNMRERMEKGIREIVLYDIQFIAKDGSIIWFEVSVKPVFKENRLTGYIGTSRDISEKKRNENEMKKCIEELNIKNKKLEELANFDMLTGAYNRRKFEHYAKIYIEKKKKYAAPFSVIMFDIDNFKQINDDYGHKKGDQTLQELSRIVKHTIRETDKLFRWGGEEFIILLSETGLKNAYKVAEKVRVSIEGNPFDVAQRVTVSLGVGEYITDETSDQLVVRIDHALLRAKSSGRNHVEFG